MNLKPLDPRVVLEFARVLAGQSRDQYATPLYRVINSTVPRGEYDQRFVREMADRTGLVMEAYLTGAAVMLKLIHGDLEPEPIEADHPARLERLLKHYGLLADKEERV